MIQVQNAKSSNRLMSRTVRIKTIAWNKIGETGNQFGCQLKQLLEWVYSLKNKEKRKFSQHGEDGITEAIFQKIGEGTKYFVEFGVQDGKQCNTRYLR